MPTVIADQDYFLDEHDQVTTDETRAAKWLAKKDGVISIAIQEQYGIPYALPMEEKVAQSDGDGEEKSESPKSNKKATPAKNKGVK